MPGDEAAHPGEPTSQSGPGSKMLDVFGRGGQE